MIRVALIVVLLSYYADSRYVKPPPQRAARTLISHAIKSLKRTPKMATNAVKNVDVMDSIGSFKEVFGEGVTNSIQVVEDAPWMANAFGRAIYAFHDTPGLIPGLFSAYTTLKETPGFMDAYDHATDTISDIPNVSTVITKPIKVITSIPVVSHVTDFILDHFDKPIDNAKKIYFRESIINKVEECKDDGDASWFDYAVEILKYKDLVTGPKIRQEKSEQCYDELRPQVNQALKKGYITPLEDPPCHQGWGAFNLYEEGTIRLITTKRYLPCDENDIT